MKGLGLPKFRLIHAAYVTHELERGKQRLTEMFGAGDFELGHDFPIGVPGGIARISYAVADCNGTTIEAIQPLGGEDGVYRRALAADPDDIVFHHFASRIDNEADWQQLTDSIERNRLDVPVRGNADGIDYLYIDVRPWLGHYLEYIYFRNQTP
jgi:hypothetical protein